MSGFDYTKRLLPFTYTAPSLATFMLQYDNLEREGGKKTATNEILDSNSSVTQDQGNIAEKFPVNVYFTGDNYDLIADGFFLALSEKYSMDNAGRLIHPRWGSIDVIPTKWKQSESFVAGKRRANFSVDFVRIYPQNAIFATVGLVISQVVGLLDAISNGFFEKIISQATGAIQGLSSVLKKSVSSIAGITKQLASGKPNVKDLLNNIETDATSLLSSDPAGNYEAVISQCELMLRTPMQFKDDTFTKINSYSEIINKLIVDNYNGGDISKEVKRNKAISLERTAGYAVATQCVAALTTNFKTRADSIRAIEALNLSYNNFLTALQEASNGT